MKSIFNFLGLLLTTLLGKINYVSPPWLVVVTEQFKKIPKGFFKILKNLFLLAVLIFGAYLGKAIYDDRPRPDVISFQISEIVPYDFSNPTARSVSIKFTKSVAPVQWIGKDVTHLIKLSPAIEGQWVWRSDKELTFKPTIKNGLDWPLNAVFEGDFSNDLISKNFDLKTRSFKIQAPNFRISFYDTNFYQDPRVQENKRIQTSLFLNYPAQLESLKKNLFLFEVAPDGKRTASKLELNFTLSETQSAIYVTTSPLKIKEKEQKFLFVLNSGIQSSFVGATQDVKINEITIPSLYDYFKIKNVTASVVRNSNYESEQVLIITNQADIASEKLWPHLEVYELPLKLDESEPSNKPYIWNSISEVTPDVLKRSQKVKLELIPSEKLVTTSHSFKFKVAPQRGLYVLIKNTAESFGGFKLKDNYEQVITVPDYPADLSIMGDGALLSLAGDKKLAVVSRNLKKYKYEIYQVRTEQVNHLIPDLVYDFKKPDTYNFNPQRIAERYEGEITLPFKKASQSQYSSLDLEPYLNKGKKGLFYIKLSSTEEGRYLAEERFFVVSDLGIIVKKTLQGQYDVFVQSIKTGQPVPQAQVSVLGQNGLNVLTLSTNAAGQVSFPILEGFKKEKKPIAFVAQVGDEISFVPFDSYSRSLDFSKFDIGGVQEQSESDQLNAFVFSDRGVYRPQEKVELALLVRNKNWTKKFKNIPVEVQITNPTGQELFKETILVNSDSIESVSFQTEDYFQTGAYQVSVQVMQKKLSQLIGQTQFHVEEFQPDQIKVRSVLSKSQTQGWVKPDDLKVLVSAYNLYGTPAENRKAQGRYKLKSTDVQFKKWPAYQFSFQEKKPIEYEEKLEPTQTKAQGDAEFKLDLLKMAEGLYRLNVDTEVFETEGGKSVKSQLTQLISRRDFAIGIKSEAHDLSFLPLNQPASIDLIAVNQELESVNVAKVKAQIIYKKPTTVLVKLPNDTYGYQTVYKDEVLEESLVYIKKGGSSYKLPVQKAGDFTLVFKTDDQQEINKINFNVVGEHDGEKGFEKSSTLGLVLNKKDYLPQDEIEIQIKAPYAGSGLITIEKDKVYASKWFTATSGSSVQKIKIPAEIEGHAYVVVTMLRNVNSKDIYTAPLSYGVIPFIVDLKQREQKIAIQSPASVQPGQVLNFKVKAQQKTKAVVYLVDEGILQVAKYKIPEPVNYYFQKKALQVTTFQILDLVMPDFSQLRPQAAGGDDAFKTGQSINPFKRKNKPPVVKWYGVVTLAEKETNFKFDVPDDFNGNLKLMVVAANDYKMGSLSSDVNVRGELIITSTAPLFTAPLDTFEVNLIVANQAKGSGEKAEITIKSLFDEQQFKANSKAEQKIIVPENKEMVAQFNFTAQKVLGSNSISFKAELGNKSAQQKIEISNRPLVPLSFENEWFYLEPKASKEHKFNLNLRPEKLKEAIQTVSSLNDLANIGMQFYYVNNYLCTEQIASQLVPLALIKNKTTEEKKNFDKLISLLRSRQNQSGLFNLYPQDVNPNKEVSLHLGLVLDFLKSQNQNFPNDMQARLINGLKADLTENNSKTGRFLKAKALYLLAQQKIVMRAELKALHEELDKLKDKKTEWNMTYLYLAAAYKLTLNDSLAKNYFDLAQKSEASTGLELLQTEAHQFEFFALELKHFYNAIKTDELNIKIKKIVEALNFKKTSTINMSTSLMALENIFSSQSKSLAPVNVENLNQPAQQKKISHTNEFPVLAQFSRAGFLANDQLVAISRGIEIEKSMPFEINGKKALSQAKIGEEIEISIKARLTQKNMNQAVVLIQDLLPAGFEVVLSSIRQLESARENAVESDSSFEGDRPTDSGEHYDSEESVEDHSGASFFKKQNGHEWVKYLALNKAYAQDTSSKPFTQLNPMNIQYVDVREDRVNVYVTLTSDVTEFKYKIKATNKGRYQWPAVIAQGLYQTQIYGNGTTTQINVE